MKETAAFDQLIEQEGWKIVKRKEGLKVLAFDREFPYAHPFAIHAKLFRSESNPDVKYRSLKAMHDYAWPEYIATWNHWDERRFKALCEDYQYISYAGGASTGKSHCAARLALLYWMAAPKARTIIVASTTLSALSVRIWGYITRLSNELAINYPIQLYGGQSPKILFDKKDPIHGMYAVAAGKGTDEKAIANWIGRHPKEAMMLVLDEAPDLDPILLKSLPNLEAGGIEFKCLVLGNSLSKFDLHGALSTPSGEKGWKGIDPLKNVQWPTTQKKGVCLFFSCHESPAIMEPDESKRELLSRFFITKEAIEEKKALYGEHSDSFYRFVLGFWRDSATDETVISRQFLDGFNVKDKAEWSGLVPFKVVAGLDPAFSSGGDQCILRLAVLGQDIYGNILLDFRGESLLFKIPINVVLQDAAEIQIADKVIEILGKYGCELGNLAIDSNGQGRALAEVIRLRAKSLQTPLKIYSVRQGNMAVNSFDVIVKTNLELWTSVRDFIQTNQIRGMDHKSILQFTTRKIIIKGSKQVLEPKKDYKNRIGASNPGLAHSPDEADAAALAVQAAMLKFGFTPGQRVVIREQNFADEKYRVFQEEMRTEEQQHGRQSIEAGFGVGLEDAVGVGLMEVFGNLPFD